MIVVIGGVKVKVDLKMALPDAPKERPVQQTIQTTDDAYQTAYAERMAIEDEFWGSGSQDNSFGGYNPVTEEKKDDIVVSHCGCAYNVARHLACMGEEVAFVSVVGKDPLGMSALAELSSMGEGVENVKDIDVSAVKYIPGQTSVVVQIRNFIGDVEFSRANENMFERITPQIIDEAAFLLDRADAIMLDGSLPKETIEYIADKYDGVKLFFDPASVEGGKKIADSEILGNFFSIMPGRSEAEAMFKGPILGPDQLEAASSMFAASGVEKIVIKMKSGGIYYRDEKETGIVHPERILNYADTSGAGDLVSAVVIYGIINGKTLGDSVKLANDAVAGFLAELSDDRPY